MQDHDFILQPSKKLKLWAITVILATIGLLVSLSISLMVKGGLLIGVAIYSLFVLRNQIYLQSRQAILGFRRLSEGTWELRTKESHKTVTLLGSSTVTNVIMVLRFRETEGKTRHYLTPPFACVLMPDSLAPDFYRRLLVILKTDKLR